MYRRTTHGITITYVTKIMKLLAFIFEQPSYHAFLRSDSCCVLFKNIISMKVNVLTWVYSRKILALLHANNKGADQPAHPRSLISAFVNLSVMLIINLLHAKLLYAS